MRNAFVTTGLATEKRPGLTKVATLEPGTKGLFSAFGKLHTFYGEGSITHANPLFQANKVMHPDGEQAVADVPYADVFNAFIYAAVHYADGSIRHHYLDNPATLTAWAPTAALTAGMLRRPTTANAYRYEVTTAGTTGSTEPAWPTTPGATVTDGTAVFTCRGTEVWDSNCPNTNGVLKAASKLFAIAGDVVRYSKTGDPRNWSEPNDAGFLPTGLNSRGDRNANALGLYQNNLVVLSRDGAQVWLVDPDPTAMKLDNVVENVGTSSPRSVANVSGDLYFLSDYGFRSITTLQYTNNLADVDVGSPIDALVRQAIKEPGVFPRATFFYGTGQYVCAVGNQVFIYSISRTAKIAAWSRYFFREEVQAFAELGQELYLRMGDDVFKLDPAAKTDDGTQYEVLIDLPYMDLKTPGQLKRIYGADVVVNGKCEFSVGYDVRDPDAYTTPVRVKGNTRPTGMLPVECCGTEFALRFRNYDAGEFRLDSVTLYYDILGAV